MLRVLDNQLWRGTRQRLAFFRADVAGLMSAIQAAHTSGVEFTVATLLLYVKTLFASMDKCRASSPQ